MPKSPRPQAPQRIANKGIQQFFHASQPTTFTSHPRQLTQPSQHFTTHIAIPVLPSAHRTQTCHPATHHPPATQTTAATTNAAIQETQETHDPAATVARVASAAAEVPLAVVATTTATVTATTTRARTTALGHQSATRDARHQDNDRLALLTATNHIRRNTRRENAIKCHPLATTNAKSKLKTTNSNRFQRMKMRNRQ